ncbi:hypothetical protein BDW42DRAFT_177316 [Aspergillus taichungensis]|uniref:Uncharacterized protein n=1 Tax=Aspergillus taichungensis TaxID=482145 RepID=A0A2J5HJ89_9EURO|nr:hypothetical protein BDW42DRAFT_177316 [Aspergillus taichungensis]
MPVWVMVAVPLPVSGQYDIWRFVDRCGSLTRSSAQRKTLSGANQGGKLAEYEEEEDIPSVQGPGQRPGEPILFLSPTPSDSICPLLDPVRSAPCAPCYAGGVECLQSLPCGYARGIAGYS